MPQSSSSQNQFAEETGSSVSPEAPPNVPSGNDDETVDNMQIGIGNTPVSSNAAGSGNEAVVSSTDAMAFETMIMQLNSSRRFQLGKILCSSLDKIEN